MAEKERTLALSPSSHYTAKCRYPGLPETFEIDLDTGAGEFLSYIDRAIEEDDNVDN